MTKAEIKVGARVRSTEGLRDLGRVLKITDGVALVHFDTGAKLWAPFARIELATGPCRNAS